MRAEEKELNLIRQLQDMTNIIIERKPKSQTEYGKIISTHAFMKFENVICSNLF